MKLDVLALDLEGTLISNAMSQIPRPGLRDFLDVCRVFSSRVVIYSALSQDRAKAIVSDLAAQGLAPPWFGRVPCFRPAGDFKDLRQIPDCVVDASILIDDCETYVHPEQRHRWIEVVPFSAPYSPADKELARVAEELAGFRP